MTTPRATYRLQLHSNFRLPDAAALVPYLQQLGIDTLYLSPIFKARTGSGHGYDVTDPALINPELGGEAALSHLLDSLEAHHMGVLFDVVPNHMASDADNRWWWDVLERGPASPFAHFFDIDWDAPSAHHQLVLPFLGRPFGEELESGAMRIEWADSGLVLAYYDRHFPLTPRSWRPLLARVVPSLKHPTERRALYALWRRLDRRENFGPLGPGDLLNRWMNQHTEAERAFRDVLTRLHGTPGQPDSWNAVEKILNMQPWRLVHFRVAASDGNYRRFFDINDLPAVAIERVEVFEHVHATLLAWAKHPAVYGLRIDHIDGLYDPDAYLQKLFSRLQHAPAHDYLLVEKILGPGESLSPRWPVAGTTGYDFLNAAMTVLLDPEGLESLTALYSTWQPPKTSEASIGNEKQQVLADLFQSELGRLVRQLLPIAAQDRWGHDVTVSELRAAIEAVTVSLPIYRTYLHHGPISSWDQQILEQALQKARTHHGHLPPAVWTLLDHVLLHADDPTLTPKQQKARRHWAMRWQQLTGPVHAKGFEDTALYRYHRLTCLNEVGSDLYSKGLSPKLFHATLIDRQARHPYALNATSTHDTKRSEDVRARLGILSEIPRQWDAVVRNWHAMTDVFAETVGTLRVPDPATEYLLFQTVVGAYPMDQSQVEDFAARLQSYLQKAVREAKVHSDWVHPNLAYEEALHRFVAALFAHPEIKAAMHPFIRTVSFYGALSSLSQVLLKTFAPGVPDYYQGSELWDLSLTDPDNRRPVDFSKRQHWLTDLLTHPPALEQLLHQWDDGRIKLYVTHHALAVRQRNTELFERGIYQGLEAEGPQADHVLAFARHHDAHWCIVVVPRHYARLTFSPRTGSIPLPDEPWQTTTLNLPAGAPRRWREILSGQLLRAPSGQLPLAKIFSALPLAILESETE